MACFVWLLPSTHSHTHTGWLTAHTPSTHHHHWVCVCSSTCSHPPHSHTRDAQAWPMHGWLLVWSPPPRPLCPTITHTHTGLGACTTATHTRHMHHHTHQGVLCVDHTMPHPPPPTPSPMHTHHMAHTHGISHTATMVLAIAHHTVHSHTQLMPHTHHTGDRPRPSTPLAVAFREPPPPRWSCPFALLSLLLVHQPLSLSSMHSHAPHVLIIITMPSIPCVWCGVCCGDGQHQAPQWW